MKLLHAPILVILLSSCAAAPPTPQFASKSVEANLDGLAKKYSIQIEFTNVVSPVKMASGDITAESATIAQLNSYAPVLVAEFGRYPVELIRKTKLQRIVLCRDLAFAGQRRNAVPDFEHHTLHLEVARGSYSVEYLRKVIHHEFFHIVDLVDDGKLYRDDDWAKLNPPNFKYGRGGKNAQNDATVSLLNNAVPGFLNAYSTTGVEEDKAEIFANMMVSYSQVEARSKQDRFVLAKVQQMRALLIRFCPEMAETLAGEAPPKSKGRAKR